MGTTARSTLASAATLAADEAPEPEAEVEDHAAERNALPRTGAGLVVLGTAGSALTGLGVALRPLARR